MIHHGDHGLISNYIKDLKQHQPSLEDALRDVSDTLRQAGRYGDRTLIAQLWSSFPAGSDDDKNPLFLGMAEAGHVELLKESIAVLQNPDFHRDSLWIGWAAGGQIPVFRFLVRPPPQHMIPFLFMISNSYVFQLEHNFARPTQVAVDFMFGLAWGRADTSFVAEPRGFQSSVTSTFDIIFRGYSQYPHQFEEDVYLASQVQIYQLVKTLLESGEALLPHHLSRAVTSGQSIEVIKLLYAHGAKPDHNFLPAAARGDHGLGSESA